MILLPGDAPNGTLRLTRIPCGRPQGQVLSAASRLVVACES